MKNQSFGSVFTVIVTILLFGISCSKEEDIIIDTGRPAPVVNGKHLVKITSIIHDAVVAELSYNERGQLISSKKGQDYFVYEQDRISRKFTIPNYFIYYHLNGGLITEWRDTLDIDGELKWNVEYTYEYDGSGHLIKETGPGPSVGIWYTMTYEWRNGNIYKKYWKTNSNDDYMIESIINYTSYENTIPDFYTFQAPYTLSIVIPNVNILGWLGYYGKRSKNLPASEIATLRSPDFPYESPGSSTYNYEYIFKDGFVTKVTLTCNDNIDGESSTYTFEYELEWE